MRRYILSAFLLTVQPLHGAHAQASAGWFGLSLDCRDCVGTAVGSGPAIITRLSPGGPAELARLKVGDTLFAINGRRLAAPQLRAALAATPPNTGLQLEIGTARGRFTLTLRKTERPLQTVGRDSLPLRYQGEYAGVSIDVLTRETPVVSRDSSGVLLIQVGGHVVRLKPSRVR